MHQIVILYLLLISTQLFANDDQIMPTVENNAQESSQARLHPLDVQPPITNVRISSVSSTAVPLGETIQPGQYSTLNNHSGVVRVSVEEIGYGDNIIAVINGQQLPISSMVNVQLLCAYGNEDPRPCRRKESTIGFLRTWDIGSNGSFTYQIKSQSYPWNTKSTFINIL